MTRCDFQRDLEQKSKDIIARGIKEFYLISMNENGPFATKFIIPEKYRCEFEPFFSGGDYGRYTNNVAEYILQFAEDCEASLIIFDDEIDSFISSLNMQKKLPPDNPEDY